MNTRLLKWQLVVVVAVAMAGMVAAQLPLTGDNSMIGKMKRTENLEASQIRRKANLEKWTMDVAEMKRENIEIHKKNNEFRERGSLFLPDGTLVKGNKVLDSQPIDPRTPQGFGNPHFREMRAEINMESDLSDFISDTALLQNVTSGIDTQLLAEEAARNKTILYTVPRYLPILGVTLGPGVKGSFSLMTDDKLEPHRWSEGPHTRLYNIVDQVYVDVDLGDIYKIFNITVWHYYLDSRAQYSQTIEFSEDGDFVNNGTVIWETGLGNLGPVETPEGITITPASPQLARYVRHKAGRNNLNYGIDFIEIAIYGMSYENTTATQDPTAGNATNATTSLNTFEEYDPASPHWPCDNPCDCFGSLSRKHRRKCRQACAETDLKNILKCNEYQRHGKLLRKMLETVRHEKKTGKFKRLKKNHPLGIDSGKPFMNMI